MTYACGAGFPDEIVSAIPRSCQPFGAALVVLDRAASAHAKPLLTALDRSVRTVAHPLDAAESGKSLGQVEQIMNAAVRTPGRRVQPVRSSLERRRGSFIDTRWPPSE